MLKTKRVYEPVEKDDGQRILVDRLWPRGVSKERAHLDAWRKDLSPSKELREWYHHDTDKWTEFRERYLQELKDRGEMDELKEIAKDARSQNITLVFAASATKHSNAEILAELIEEMDKAA